MTTTTLTGENGTTVTIEYSELADETSEGTVIANVTVTAAMGHTLSELFLEIPSGVVDGEGNNLQHSLGYSIDGGDTIVSSYNEGLWPPGYTTYTFQLVATKDIDFSDFNVVDQLQLTPFIGLDDSSVYDEFSSVDVPVAEELENLPPTDIALSADSIAENSAVGTVVGVLSAIDSDTDAGDLTYTLDDDADGLFGLETVDGEVRLVVKGALDHETAASHAVTVTVSDGEGSHTETLTIGVTDVQEGGEPFVSDNENFLLTMEDTVVPGTVKAGTVLSTMTVTISGNFWVFFGEHYADLGLKYEGDLYSDTYVNPDNGYDLLEIEGSGTFTVSLVATADTVLADDFNFDFFLADYAQFTWEKYMSVAIAVDATPGDIALTVDTIAETAAVDTVVGVLSATDTDTDAGDLTFTLDDDAGGLFRIETVGGETRLVLNAALDFETAATHEVTVEVSDGESTHTETFTINITDEIDVVEGTSGKDNLKGTAGADIISGFKGNDKLEGLAGADTLIGGKGIDKLYGGADGDIFLFAKGDTGNTRAKADTIYDFLAKEGDRIDLSDWDANEKKSGDQDFKFIGGQDFHGKAGELRFVKEKSDTWIMGDTDGDRKADFMIHLDDAVKLKADHFDL